MPAPRHQFTESDRELLRHALERKLAIRLEGRSACIKAAALMKERGGYAPSANTLYHVLQDATSGRKPYLATLDALSVFLGFKDWHGLRMCAVPVREEPGLRLDQVYALPALLSRCMQQGCHAVVDDFLDEWRDRLDHVSVFDIGLAIYTVLYKHPELERPFYARYAAHPVVRAGFFELMADPDFHLAHAAEGLQQYLEASGPEDEETAFRDRLFARAMLFRHHYLNGDGRMTDQGRVLYSDPLGRDALAIAPLFPATRYLTYALWYDVLERRTARRQRREAMVIDWAAERLLKDRSPLERNIVLHTLVEGLLQVDLLDRVLPDILRLFPEVDADAFKDPARIHELLTAREPNGLRVHFKRIAGST